jgi:hypothetical protein
MVFSSDRGCAEIGPANVQLPTAVSVKEKSDDAQNVKFNVLTASEHLMRSNGMICFRQITI